MKEDQFENGNGRNRSTLIDEFEQENDEDDDEEKSGTRKTKNRKNTDTLFDGDTKKKRKTINDQ